MHSSAFRVGGLRVDFLMSWNVCCLVRAIFFSSLLHARYRPGDSPTITECVLLHSVCASRCSRNLSAKHRPRIDPECSGCDQARPFSTTHLSMISVNNQRQHVGGEGKPKKQRTWHEYAHSPLRSKSRTTLTCGFSAQGFVASTVHDQQMR